MYSVLDLDKKEHLFEILGKIGDLPDKHINGKIYITCKLDDFPSHDYEKLSLMGYLGVVANSKTVGHCLCVYLQMIIDNDWVLLCRIVQKYLPDNEQVTFDEIVECLDKEGQEKIREFKRNEPIKFIDRSFAKQSEDPERHSFAKQSEDPERHSEWSVSEEIKVKIHPDKMNLWDWGKIVMYIDEHV